MKKKFLVFKAEYKNSNDGTWFGVNHLVLVATFEASGEKEARQFVGGGGGPYYLWTTEERNVEEAK